MDRIKYHVEKQVRWITQLKYEDIPEEVYERAKWVLLDSIGCILNGMNGRCIPYEEDGVLKSAAAMVSTELYEGNRFAVGHPASHIVPLLLEEIRKRDITYKEALRIFICAYEIAARWGDAVRFTDDILGHGTIMISGPAVVEGMLERMTEDNFAEYILLCESLPEVSTWQSVFEGSALHDYYPGIAEVNVRHALFMLKDGVRSSGTVLKSIFEDIIMAKLNEEKLSAKLGNDWYLLKNYFKVHSGCRFIHPFADIIQELKNKGLKKDDIEHIHIYTYKKASRLVKQNNVNALGAKFSTPISLATLIIKGRLYPSDFEDVTENKEIMELSECIYLEEAERYNTMLPDIRGGCVMIKKKNGDLIKKEVFHAAGDFDNPDKYTEEKLFMKFREVTKDNLDAEQQENIRSKIMGKKMNLTAGVIFEDYFKAVGQEVI